jgi:hypothetical protein
MMRANPDKNTCGAAFICNNQHVVPTFRNTYPISRVTTSQATLLLRFETIKKLQYARKLYRRGTVAEIIIYLESELHIDWTNISKSGCHCSYHPTESCC